MPSGRRTTDSPVALYCALGFLFVLILLGGGTRLWSQALCLIGVGGFLIWRPPLRSPGKIISIAAVGLFLLAVASFLPIPSGFREIWWVEAVNGLGIHLPPTISSQPRVTAEGLAIMTAGLGWSAFFVLIGSITESGDECSGSSRWEWDCLESA